MPMSNDFKKKKKKEKRKKKEQEYLKNENEKEKVPDSYSLNPDITWVSFCKTILSLFFSLSLSGSANYVWYWSKGH